MLTCSTLVLLLIVASGGTPWSSSAGAAVSDGETTRLDVQHLQNDKLLDGLLVPGFDEKTCLSRYQKALYWKSSTSHKPSGYLVEKLREYEARHKKCGPGTDLYTKATQQLKTGVIDESSECKYVIWLAEAGLGNRLISLASTFLYAVLTDKVLLASIPNDLHGIFCEPFLGTSWALPADFPLKDYAMLWSFHQQSLGTIMKNKEEGKTLGSVPAFAYLHIMHDSSNYDKMFFCDEPHELLRKVPWLVLRANVYFGPGLHLIPQFRDELNRLFPEKGTMFHLLGRYLLHPTNSVWGGVVRYYNSYLAKASERVGLQIRVFTNFPVSFEDMLSQVINCTLNDAKVLPEVITNDELQVIPSTIGSDTKAVLVTSLTLGYFEKLRNMYYEHSTATGEQIAVYQPSHEEIQHTERANHNAKALQEMYLLSFTDKIVTTAWSTFGYVAQSLGGLEPWIVARPGTRGPACSPSPSMEPCFQNPPKKDCSGKDMDPGKVLPYLRTCEDAPWGIRLFNN